MNGTARIQRVIARWVESRFGHLNQSCPQERAMRVLEEAVELAQSVGLSQADATRGNYVLNSQVKKAKKEESNA